MKYIHKPALINKIKELLPLKNLKLIVDATLGLGGHSKFFLLNSEAKIIAIDKDKFSIDLAKANLKDLIERITFINGDFKYIKKLLNSLGIDRVDLIFADLGVSSYQLEEPQRGFSFQKNGPLDMRFNPDQSLTAADVINKLDENALSNIFKIYGEEHFHKKIAEAIIKGREKAPIATTIQLAEIIKKAKKIRTRKHHPATLVFQALRIYVNDELEALKEFLRQSIELIEDNGYLAVISYHSIEDRVVKKFFKEISQLCKCKKIPCECGGAKIFSLISKKAIKPEREEIIENPRVHSARLRIIQKKDNLIIPFQFNFIEKDKMNLLN